MNETCIWQYVFLGEVCVCVCVWGGGGGGGGGCKNYFEKVNDDAWLQREGGGGQEPGQKWLLNKWMLLTM